MEQSAAIIWLMGKARYKPTKIRLWRKHRDLTLERLAARMQAIFGDDAAFGTTPSNLSKVERGELPYSQPLLEALAVELRCTPADLLEREPGTEPEPPLDPLDGLTPPDRRRVEQMIELLRRTSTAA